MFYINGIPYYLTKDLAPFKDAFWYAVKVYGWEHESQGLWRGDVKGNNGLTLAQWVDRQKLIHTKDIINATGISRAYISKVANENDLKPVSKGRWRLETVRQLLRALGRFTPCPKCRGLAGVDKQGNVTCFECE